MTSRERRLEAPHRRLETASRSRAIGRRALERIALVVYRSGEWIIGRLPRRLVEGAFSVVLQGSYLLWPTKRRWSNTNFGHVLGLPPDDPAVRRVARAAYRSYARYLVELMRLPRMSDAEVEGTVEPLELEAMMAIWHESNGLILTIAHIGSNEAVGRGMAHHGLPFNVVADDSTFPELFEHLRRQREEWSVKLIPWRNLREIFNVLRRREILVLLVDWGYRPDGVPVTLFDAWTTLPAGPAFLAGKTGATILPITIRRIDDRRFHVEGDPPIRVPSTSDRDVAAATQQLAGWLERTIAAAPDQWYSFKPIWPLAADEQRTLEERATAMRSSSAVERSKAGPTSDTAGGDRPRPDDSAPPPAGPHPAVDDAAG